ncbi:MAG: DUF4286 family protein [Crocinitomicaceae bacterium]
MILYNVTVSIDPAVSDEWVAYMREKHIPEVLETGCFLEARLCRVNGEEEGGKTYATTYLCASQELFDHYEQHHAGELRKEFNAKWAGKHASFRTFLDLVEEFKAK